MPTRFSFETDTAFSGRKTVDGDDADPAPAGRFGIAAQHQVTGDLIDEAVNAVMKERQVDDATADTFRHLMSSDPTTGIAQAYYQSKAASGLARSHLAAEKKRMTIPYVLTDKQVADLTSYAPEYSLEFRGSALHDHSVSAASRMIDQALVESKVPPGVRFSDVGGSPEHHAKRAAQNVHICQPKVDRKDPARAVQRDMKLRNLAVNSAEAAVRRFATSYLDGDPAIVCDSLAQDCKVQTPVVISVHVYDVPMVDWPTIMESKGARLVEGCMLYSPRVMEEVSGLFPVAGAHFEADPQRDIFRMGFVGSPSWWYEHSWLEYCKYGVDQILYGKKGAYSYKVTERRGDTIFFRILPVSSGIPRNVHQVFRLPDVQMVEVHGYDVGPMAATSRVLRRKTWLWPMPLWRDMMRHGLEMVERNTLSHERLYNYYRTIAPRQTINAHLVAGGYTVPMNELVPLIVHVAMAAAAAVLGSQTVSRQIVGAEMAVRRRGDEYTVTKLVSAFASTVKAAFGVVLFPVTMLGDAISKTASRTIQSQLVDWAPRAVCRPVNAKFLVMDVKGFSSNDFSTDDVDFSREVQEDAPFDHIRAAMADPDLAVVILDKFADCLPTNVIDDLQKQVDKHKAEKSVDKQKLKSGSRVDPSDTSSTLVDSQSRIGVVKQREDAVLEAIVECEMEQKKIQASCFLTFRELCHSRPSVSIIKKRAEEFRNPDFWWVESGVISGGATSTSVLGVAVEDFMHAAVFTPVQNPDSDSFIRPVFSSDYSGSSKGSAVVRSHTVLSDSSYTGWVMTNDSLLIYNGPEIVETMRLALTRGFDYSVKLVQGPPGCGKTTSIVHSFRSDSVVLCPVRKSTEETRGRLVDEFDDDAVDFRNLVRTLDSYLVNYPVNGKMRALTPSRLLADEGFMSHSGKWHAAAALLGVDEVEVFGDRFQIPHVPRAEAPKMHLRIQPDVVQEQWLTYRCPPDAVAAWGHVYGWRVRSTSTVTRSLKHVPSHRGLNIPFDCVMMGMYQADKKELKQMYSNCGTKVRIMTVHESEGNTYDHVWLHRFDRRKRSDEFSLYDKQPYVLVAMSRHRQSFTYICPELDDLTSRWIKQAKDVRRVQAASDVETAGEPKEFY